MSHDQLAKTLISTFFADFLRLTLADTAPRLRLGETVFVDKELFTDWPTGDRRELDLLARVPVEQEDVYLLVHVEIESRASDAMRQRLWWYYMQIRLKYRLLVLPILVNLRGGRSGMELVMVEEGFEPLATGLFRYRSLNLAGCRAADWLSRPEPVAWALAALMDPGDWSRAALKVECLRRVQKWGVAGFGKDVLVNWIETYVQLSGDDATEFRRLLALKRNKEIRRMDQTWLGKSEAKGFEKGKAAGFEKGKVAAVGRMRRMVLKRIERRFGPVPEPVQARVLEITSIATLARLLEKLPSLQSPEDLLPRRNGRSKSTV